MSNDPIENDIKRVVSEYDNPSGAVGWSRLHAEQIYTETQVEVELRRIADEYDVDYSTVVQKYHAEVNKSSSGLLPF